MILEIRVAILTIFNLIILASCSRNIDRKIEVELTNKNMGEKVAFIQQYEEFPLAPNLLHSDENQGFDLNVGKRNLL